MKFYNSFFLLRLFLLLMLIYCTQGAAAYASHSHGRNRSEGIRVLIFYKDTYYDSIAARHVYNAISNILLQTQYFIVLSLEGFKLTQEEINRQKGRSYIESAIVEEGKSTSPSSILAIDLLSINFYMAGRTKAVHVKYDLQIIDIMHAHTFNRTYVKGFSFPLNKTPGQNLENTLSRGRPVLRKWRGISFDQVLKLSVLDKHIFYDKIQDAVEESSRYFNKWVRQVYHLNLDLLEMHSARKNKRIRWVLVEGGENVGFKKGQLIKIVRMNYYPVEHYPETATAQNADITVAKDYEPIADVKIVDVRPQTALCIIIKDKGLRSVKDAPRRREIQVVF